MASIAFYLSAVVLFTQSTVHAANCNLPPVYVDIHRRTVQGSTDLQYGSFIGVGTPEFSTRQAQNNSLWPSLTQNHTSFASPTFCKNSTLRECEKYTGGVYITKDSTTFRESKDLQSLDTDRNTTVKGRLVKDTLRLYTHYFETEGDPATQTALEDAVIKVADSGSVRPGVLGIGQSSTVLQDLVKQNKIAGRTYSLYIGQGFERADGIVNGSTTFGGYDHGRFTGKVHSFPMTPSNPSPFSVKVKDIYITDSKTPKSNVSLFDTVVFPSDKKVESFNAQITTDQYPLSLPYQITQNFIMHMEAQKDNYWGDNSLKLKNAFNGTLSIVIEGKDGDFVVTLPPEIFMNKTNITPIQDRDEKSTAPFLLSTAFLTQVYLMADFDASQFHLAKAVAHHRAVMPVTFCPNTVPIPYERPDQSAWSKQGLIGAVVGGVIGGMGIAIALYYLVIVCLRRRMAKENEQEVEKGLKAKKMAQFQVEEVQEFDPPPKKSKKSFWKRGN